MVLLPLCRLFRDLPFINSVIPQPFFRYLIRVDGPWITCSGLVIFSFSICTSQEVYFLDVDLMSRTRFSTDEINTQEC
ncbi:hypothetical protein NDU88_004500 [Pleurodeles waltl]|uniref:Uncharacterized protein n=1 Tax=Pleurodeles waltl TaxID=8319 RepID=A0AAV7WW34_PLEWA|nr:hypothetical protein NDU88_004500 [Pleurodeles waltl]